MCLRVWPAEPSLLHLCAQGVLEEKYVSLLGPSYEKIMEKANATKAES